MANKPIHSFKLNGVQAAVFGSRDEGAYKYSVVFEKRFKDKETDEWKSTKYFSLRDILSLQAILVEIAKLGIQIEEPKEDSF